MAKKVYEITYSAKFIVNASSPEKALKEMTRVDLYFMDVRDLQPKIVETELKPSDCYIGSPEEDDQTRDLGAGI